MATSGDTHQPGSSPAGLAGRAREAVREARAAARGARAAYHGLASAGNSSHAAPAPATDASATSLLDREAGPGRLGSESEPVTTILYERLTAEDVESVEAAIRAQPELWREHFGEAAHASSRDQLLALGVWLRHPELLTRTGLVFADPPEAIHAMNRGSWNAAGGLYEANLVVDALLGVGVEMGEIERALDFGCSSGRVLKPLRAAFPEIAWSGCDPNGPAIEWAAENVPGIDFFVSPSLPPLEGLPERSLDLVYAISIWSHFNPPGSGRWWLHEMRRLLKPGGYLVLTTHGYCAVQHFLTTGQRSPEQSREIVDALYRSGCWYAAEFGDRGDWGVVDPEWGTSFLTPEWLLTQLCPHWRVLDFAPGRNQDNQDVYVLQRV